MGAGAAAARIPTRCNVRRRVTAAQTAGAVALGLLVVALAALAASRLLETPAYRPSTLQTSWVPTEIILFVLIAVAFVGFARRAERDGDLLMRGLAVAAPLGGGAVLTYAIGPAFGAGWIIADQLFLLGAYAAILGGAWAESAAHSKRFVQLASAEERRRLAQDLHDGLAQDLLYIVVQARALAERHPDAEAVRGLVSASERALDESRGALGTLTYASDEPLARVLGNCVREVAHRAGAEVSLRVDGELEPSAGVREAVLRIAREATWNAVRHGPASDVLVTLQAGDPLRVTVSDDGSGFDVEDALRDGRGFGLEKHAKARAGRWRHAVDLVGAGPGDGDQRHPPTRGDGDRRDAPARALASQSRRLIHPQPEGRRDHQCRMSPPKTGSQVGPSGWWWQTITRQLARDSGSRSARAGSASPVTRLTRTAPSVLSCRCARTSA